MPNVRSLCIRDVIVVDLRLPLTVAAELMRQADLSELPAVELSDEGVRLVGVLTVHDLLLVADARDLDWLGALTVADVMTTEFSAAHEDDDLGALLAHFGKHGVYRMPVVDGRGCFVGVVPLGDVVAWLTEDTSDEPPRLSGADLLPPADMINDLPAHTD